MSEGAEDGGDGKREGYEEPVVYVMVWLSFYVNFMVIFFGS